MLYRISRCFKLRFNSYRPLSIRYFPFNFIELQRQHSKGFELKDVSANTHSRVKKRWLDSFIGFFKTLNKVTSCYIWKLQVVVVVLLACCCWWLRWPQKRQKGDQIGCMYYTKEIIFLQNVLNKKHILDVGYGEKGFWSPKQSIPSRELQTLVLLLVVGLNKLRGLGLLNNPFLAENFNL